MPERLRKASAAALLSLLLMMSAVGFLAPRQAQAQLVVSDPVTGANTTINNFEDFLDKVLLGGVTMGFINALNYFAQKIAYDAAVFIAAGGRGEGPLFQYKDFGSYLGDIALGAAGEAIGTFSQIGFLGFNLCEPTGAGAPRISLAVQLGIAAQYQPPTPRCEWSRIAGAWDQFTTSFETGEVLRNIQLSVGPGQTGLHGYFEAPLKVREKVDSEKVTGKLEREEGQGFKSLTDVVTGKQKTPAAVVRETALEQTARQPGQQQASTASVIGPVLSQGVLQVLSVALGTFVNTLASQLLSRAFTEGSFNVTGFDLACAFRDNVPESRDALSGLNCPPDLNNPDAVTRGGQAAARAAYAGLLAPRVQEVTAYDAVAEFTVCPDTFRGPNNCAMDPGFAAGVRVALQGEPISIRLAIEQGYLHADWPLVSPTGDGASRNADPFCFNNGYCYSNLLKLRKARIIPIGFELAAEQAEPDTTLGKVVNAFNDCTGPNGRFCHLIDPDWIIKYPLTQCRAKVFGPTLLAGDSDIRAEICVDAPTCIAENPDGTCGAGFGYCTKEKNIWRLKGDVCPAQYASCQTYQGPAGRAVSVLKNTVDKAICSVDNAGCNWYATAQDEAAGTGDWRADQGRLFLDRDAGTCQEDNAGCSELVRREGVSANLVRNPSFESREQTATRPDQWLGVPAAYATDLTSAPDGATAVNPGAPGVSQRIGVDAGTAYTVSVSARRAAGGAAGRVNLVMRLRDAAGAALVVEDIDSSCDPDGAASDTLTLRIDPASGTVFTRDTCTVTAPFGAETLELALTSTGGALADAVQLEYGAAATPFRAAAYAGEQRAYLKQPPAWMGCTGEASDPAECAGYAGVCRPDEVGCDAYTARSGGPAIPGIVSAENRCDASCAGYATYKEEASTLSYSRYPVHLIPSRGRTCSVAAAGCTEFTNLDAAAAGGEAREYYATLRACEKPRAGETVPVYYTWEGSDTTGFQLKEWRLKADIAGAGGARPPAVIRGTDPGSCTRDIYLAGSNPDCREFFDVAGNLSYRLYSKTIVISPDCRPLRMTVLPTDPDAGDAATCAARGGRFVDGSCSVCEGLGGVWNNPAGADLACTFNAFAPESKSCAAAEAGCRLYAGNAGANIRQVAFYDFETGDRAEWGPDADTAVSTESTAVGGHSIRVAARGTLSHAVFSSPRIIQGNTYYLTFWGKGRGAVTARFSGAPADRAFTAGGITLGATWNRYALGPVLVDWAPGPAETLILSGFGDTSFVDRIELTTVASNIALVKDSWTIPAVCDQNASGAFLPQAQLGCTEYRALRAGRTEYLTGFASLCREKAVGCTAFVATQQSPSPGRDTWNALCVLPAPTSAPAPCSVDGREVCTVGVNRQSCRYQTDDVPTEVTFSIAAAGLCQVDGIVIVDRAGVPVRRGSAGACTGLPQDLIVVPADQSVYLVDDPAMQCEAEVAGCMLAARGDGQVCTMPDTAADADSDPDACVPGAGRETCDCFRGAGAAAELLCQVKKDETACRAPLPFREPFPAGTKISYAETTVLNDPKKYDQSLCTIEAVSCQEWTEVGPTTGKAYFKDPETRTCEYRERVSVGGRTLNGWFRTGTDNIACDPALLVSGESYGIWRNGDDQYRGFVGMCPAAQSTCSEFLDPGDRDTRYPLGRPYTFLKNQKLDTATCRGQVNPLGGCVLFNDTTDPNVTANAAVTNAASVARGNASASPVTCPGTGCNQCLYRKIDGRRGSSEFDRWTERTDGTLCNASADCAGTRDGETATCVSSGGGEAGVAGLSVVYWLDPAPGDTRFHFVDAYGSEQPSIAAFRNTLLIYGNDANTVLKVTRDRVCGEWLACQSSTPVWDPSRNRFVEICDAIGRCNEYQRNGDSTQCVSWVNKEPKVLTANTYKERNVSYAGQDYSGYSIPHLYDVESLRQIPVGRFCTGNTAISCTQNSDCEPDSGICNPTPSFRLARVIGTCAPAAADGSVCTSADFPERGQGECWQGSCAQAPNGSPVETDTVQRDEPQPLIAFGESQNAEAAACRAYPERNAPFPNSIVKTWIPDSSDGLFTRARPQATSPNFNRANVCEKGQACECTYKKIEYKGAQSTVYLSVEQTEPFSLVGICQGGKRDKQPCSPDAATSPDIGCPDGGTCQQIERSNIVQGLIGYCLERDMGLSINGLQESSPGQPGRACITWLPVDRLSGSIDVYNNYANAGFNIANASFCAVPDAYKRVPVFSNVQSHRVSVSYGGVSYPFKYGCAESTLSEFQTAYTPLRGEMPSGGGVRSPVGPRVELEDSVVPEVDCPAETGFVVLSRSPKGSGNYECEVDFAEDDDFQYFCVPRNSRHLADPNKSVCLPPPPSIGVKMQRYNESSGALGLGGGDGYVAPADIPRYVRGTYAEIWSIGPQIQSDAGFVHPGGAEITRGDGGDVAVGSAVAYYGDCVATDSPIPAGTTAPGTPFFGCEAAVEIATGGIPSRNKVITGIVGNGRTQPPGSAYVIADAVENLRYAWPQTPADVQPYGRINTADIRRQTVTNRDFTPVEIMSCVNAEASDLPNAENRCVVGTTRSSSEGRPYETITAGPRGTSCPPGAEGDIFCSRRAPGGGGAALRCGVTPSDIKGCYWKCQTDADCSGRGRCIDHPNIPGTGLCETPEPGDWSRDISSCQSDTHRVLVGTCRSSGARDGFDCRKDHDEDCAAVSCVGTGASASSGVCTGSGTGGATACDRNGVCRSYNGPAVTPNLPNVLSRLQQLFAAVYDVFLYRNQDTNLGVDAAYVLYTGDASRTSGVDYTPGLSYDISDTIGAPPVVRSVGACNTQNQCLEGDEGRMTVNDVDTGQVKGGNGFKQVTLKFFGYAQTDQMPIRNVSVDWGDGTTPSGNNPGSSYKNRRGYEYRRVARADGTEGLELVSKCDEHDFGTSSDACDSIAPFAFNHSYICNRDASARCYDRSNGCVQTVDGRPACVYTPKVQLTDNWGFCNGTCTGGPAGDSCYDATTNATLVAARISTNECHVPDNPAAAAAARARGINPFTDFAGQVVVFPRE